MSLDEVMANQLGEGERCTVCGKSVGGGGGYLRLNRQGRMLALCCPLCVQTFEREPQRFLRSEATRAELREIFDLLRPAANRQA